ncbi:M14 family metallopeptidase [Ideonella sp. A 288]|uniref:M14 family metallopeptidase n=1 Tax=Ideonella sp. A 288 TaxID=1962181 RepID=UPI000B4AB600|nr:M14 family metallopeptidase [Ideonella sp. A 288]
MNGTVSAAFSQTYAEARGKFVAAAEAAGLDVEVHPHPMIGRDGEALSMDVVRDGPADAASVLILSSACHGVEGFCGSGAQVALVGNAAHREAVRRSGVAVLYIHGLNPYGFSWWRRTTQENVDLNRNFHDFHRPLPRNTGYDEIAHLLVPSTWPPSAGVQAAQDDYIARHGLRAWQTAITAGQYDHPEGLFYGGRNPTWSQQTLRQVLRDHGQRCRQLGWIDLHTGLGPSGVGERIFACRDDAAALARVRGWWGAGVTSIYDGSSTSALLSGLMWLSAYEECPQAIYSGIALEYGTVPIGEVLDALRADQWLENHPEAGEPQREAIKRRVRDAFYTDTDAWKQRIVEQATEAMHQALTGLSAAA